jgi:hypothetical protein
MVEGQDSGVQRVQTGAAGLQGWAFSPSIPPSMQCVLLLLDHMVEWNLVRHAPSLRKYIHTVRACFGTGKMLKRKIEQAKTASRPRREVVGRHLPSLRT